MDIKHSSTAETGSSISDQVQKTVGKKIPISLSPEQIGRIERLHEKYENWVRRGIVEPLKYKPTPTPEEFAHKHKIGVFRLLCKRSARRFSKKVCPFLGRGIGLLSSCD